MDFFHSGKGQFISEFQCNLIIYFHIYFSVLNMASDMVANVRFNVAKTLTIIGPKLNSSVMTAQIKPVLSKWF